MDFDWDEALKTLGISSKKKVSVSLDLKNNSDKRLTLSILKLLHDVAEYGINKIQEK